MTAGDPKHPYPTHLHLHAVLGPWDKASFYRRNVVFNGVCWYELEDLIAEIRSVPNDFLNEEESQ